MAVADRFAFGTAPQVIVQVRSAIKRWAEFAEHAGVPGKETGDRKRQLMLLPHNPDGRLDALEGSRPANHTGEPNADAATLRAGRPLRPP